MSADWAFVVGLTFGLLWMVPAFYLGRANGINHATWRTKQAVLQDIAANSWKYGEQGTVHPDEGDCK